MRSQQTHKRRESVAATENTGHSPLIVLHHKQGPKMRQGSFPHHHNDKPPTRGRGDAMRNRTIRPFLGRTVVPLILLLVVMLAIQLWWSTTLPLPSQSPPPRSSSSSSRLGSSSSWSQHHSTNWTRTTTIAKMFGLLTMTMTRRTHTFSTTR